MKKFKEILSEIKASNIVKNKLDNIERMKTVRIPTPEERRAKMAAALKKASEESSKEKVIEGKDDPCWSGYKQLGMKDKNGKKVPNCVKESLEAILARMKQDAERQRAHREKMAKHAAENKPIMDKMKADAANRPVPKLSKDEIEKIKRDANAEHEYNRKRGWSNE